VVTHQLQVERGTGKVRQSETDVLPLCHAAKRAADTCTVYRRVLVFGGNGLLGSSAVDRLLERGHEVWAVSRGNFYWDSVTRIAPRLRGAIACDRNHGVHACAELVSLVDSVGQSRPEMWNSVTFCDPATQ